MKYIPHLFAGAIEADVTKRAAAQVGIDPVRKNPLIGRSELAGARQHAAAIDPDRKVERFAIFQRDGLAGQLGAAVKRDGRAGGELDADAIRRNTRRKRRGVIQLKGVSIHAQRERAKAGIE